jgi:hypothetical protein
MIPCPYCESENVIRTAPLILEYLCIDCREKFMDYIELADWYDDDYEEKTDEFEPTTA